MTDDASTTPGGPSGDGPRLCLVAAADLMTATRLAQLAKSAGWQTRIVANEAARDEALANRQAEAIVIDLEDRAGGVDVVARTRAVGPDLRIVAVGPHKRPDLLVSARSAGADHVLTNSEAERGLPKLLLA